jgi:serine/threonine protein kinase
MKFPQMDQYHQAIQNPNLVFEDVELKNARLETDQFGMPRVSSGGFALTYRLNGPGKAWAVRCFHREVSDRQKRYVAISQFLNQNPQPFFVPTDYLSAGIRVNTDWYPITKMAWVDGETLYRFIERNINDLAKIKPLSDQFLELVATLERLGVAHGDLQHGNILVSNGRLVLVDYDGMFVPALNGLLSEERGHVNFQHPLRNTEYRVDIDRFSAIVIFLALKALTPERWKKYSSGGENLLFKQDDFRAPQQSPLLNELEAVPEMRPLIQQFRAICQRELDKVPRLTDFIGGNLSTTVSTPIQLTTRQSQYEVIDASRRNDLLARVGQRVTVVGCILDQYHSDYNPNHTGRPFAFLNFGNRHQGDLTLVMWSDTLQLFNQQKKNIAQYQYQWVSVTGLIDQYKKDAYTPARPQIVISSPSEIEILKSAEEAKARLGISVASNPAQLTVSQLPTITETTKPPEPVPTKQTLEDQISELYQKRRPSSPPAWEKATQQPAPQASPKPEIKPLTSQNRHPAIRPLYSTTPSSQPPPKKGKKNKNWWEEVLGKLWK